MDREQLRIRSLTAAVLGVVVVGLLLAGRHATMALIVLIGFMSAIEFYRITVEKELSPHTFVFATFTCIPLVVYIFDLLNSGSPGPYLLPGWTVFLSAPLLLAVYFALNIRRETQVTGRRARNYALALVSITAPCIFGLALVDVSQYMLLGIFILIWISDVTAYLVGSQFGRRKLAPTISPGKTWEGTIGATMISLPCGALLSGYFFEASWQTGLAVATLVVVFGTLGDLWQSMFKRLHAVKDSGTILPGHGGFWDRFDSFLGCVPWIGAYYLILLL